MGARGRRGRWRACRSRSRTSSTPRASRPPTARGCSAGTCPRATRRRSGACARPARSCSARPPRTSSRGASARSTTRSGRSATRAIPSAWRAAPAAARPPRWRPGWRRWRSGRTRAARSACPSAFCGTYGLKPTWGRGRASTGVWPLARTLDHAGPMARTPRGPRAAARRARAGAAARRAGTPPRVGGLPRPARRSARAAGRGRPRGARPARWAPARSRFPEAELIVPAFRDDPARRGPRDPPRRRALPGARRRSTAPTCARRVEMGSEVTLPAAARRARRPRDRARRLRAPVRARRRAAHARRAARRRRGSRTSAPTRRCARPCSPTPPRRTSSGCRRACSRTGCSSPDRRAPRRSCWPSHPRSRRSKVRETRRAQGKSRAALIGGSYMRGRSTSRWLLACAATVLSLAFASTASADSYIVLYKGNAVPSSAKADVQQAGGTFVYAYDKIGVAIARSDSAAFAATLGKDNRVEGVSSTAGFASQAPGAGRRGGRGPQPATLPNAPATDSDSLSPLQWDMRQIHTPRGARDHGRQPVRASSATSTRARLHAIPDLRAERRRRRQRQLLERRRRSRARSRPTTTTATARTPRARSRRRRTASASSASRRT